MHPSSRSLILAALLGLLAFGGCGDATVPSPPEGDEALFEGAIDPKLESFLLARIDQPGVVPLRLDLVGNNLVVDEENARVLIDVAVINRGSTPLHPQAILWIMDIQPPRVSVANADILPPTMSANSPIPIIFGFDYSEYLGDDGVLEPGETSEAKTWIFWDPEMVSFSFTARAEFSLRPQEASISGVVFNDENQNGIQDADEGPFGGAMIVATRPNGQNVNLVVGPEGRYRLELEEAGLHSLRLEVLVDCVSCITTPNPRQVMIVPNSSGVLQSVDGVDFGALCGPCRGEVPRVQLSEDPPDAIQPQDSYDLLEARIEGPRLWLRVGFSGCGPEHPFELVAGRAFMESMPVATWLRLRHDGRGELCAGYFERELSFDLGPIQEAHIADYGAPGIVRLLFRSPDGEAREFLLEP